jgi:hypothetical protein
MKRKEIEKKKVELNKILKEPDTEKEPDTGARRKKLEALAKEVGASVTRMGKVLVKQGRAGEQEYREENQITESEIVHNIQESLQTHVMIDMCNTAARNFWITLVAMLIAVFAMLAAWTGVVVDWWCSQ